MTTAQLHDEPLNRTRLCDGRTVLRMLGKLDEHLGHLMKEAIKTPSDAIRGQHGKLYEHLGHLMKEATNRPSDAIRGHQTQSGAIRGVTEAIIGHLLLGLC